MPGSWLGVEAVGMGLEVGDQLCGHFCAGVSRGPFWKWPWGTNCPTTWSVHPRSAGSTQLLHGLQVGSTHTCQDHGLAQVGGAHHGLTCGLHACHSTISRQQQHEVLRATPLMCSLGCQHGYVVDDACRVGGGVEANLGQGLAVSIHNALDACAAGVTGVEDQGKFMGHLPIGGTWASNPNAGNSLSES